MLLKLTFVHDLPLIPVHHIAGHIYASQLEAPLQFPLMSLVISGGHTELIYMKDHMSLKSLEKRDDAVGEAFDKVARVIDLPYPGAVTSINWLKQVKILLTFQGD